MNDTPEQAANISFALQDNSFTEQINDVDLAMVEFILVIDYM